MNNLRKDLPEIPDRIKRLPVDRGYPVPWFVTWLDENGERVPRGQGTPEFRVMDEEALKDAIQFKLCWVCGQKLGAFRAFTIGPMCTVNLSTAEPPSHLECAVFSAKACPFLSKPNSRRRENDLPAEALNPVGVSIPRNPEVTCIWVTKGFSIRRVPRIRDGEITGIGIMFGLGAPEETKWFHSGREATREEVIKAIKSGEPALREYADGPIAHKSLDTLIKNAMERIPA
jgi:hypothetical protein